MVVANLKKRYAIVKVQNLAPVEIRVLDIEPAPALVNPARIEAFVAKLTALDEYTKPTALIEQEIAERPLKLIQEAAEWRHAQEAVLRQPENNEAFDE